MTHLWHISIVFLAGLAAALLIFWLVAVVRIVRTMFSVPTARAARSLRSSVPASESVCVVIPAHNESLVIEKLVASLLAQDHPTVHFVLALDRCTDDTAAKARSLIRDDPRFTIVEIDSCPEEWAGKVHAIHSAATRVDHARRAEVLIFADADTTFAPDCVGTTLRLMNSREIGLLSLVSTLTFAHWFEKLLQPAAGVELMKQFPLMRAAKTTGRRPFANGQFIMMRRAAYDMIGGHQAVRNELLEDLAIARLAAGHNIPAGVFLADTVLHCSMYPAYPAFRRGWKRIYTESANRRPERLRQWGWRCRVISTLLPIGASALTLIAATAWPHQWASMRAPALVLGSAALLVYTFAVSLIYRLGHSPLWTVPGYPIGSWIVGGILIEAAEDLEKNRPIIWGGREYMRERR
ncbi:MAG: glycosyltransferase [Phycisphaerales bacterium]|nr:glycosyltransferase [Phycisphaerales bacterium]